MPRKINSAEDLSSEWGQIAGEPHPHDVVARAATAVERERCAKIAETTCTKRDGEFEAGFDLACDIIADAIRNPK